MLPGLIASGWSAISTIATTIGAAMPSFTGDPKQALKKAWDAQEKKDTEAISELRETYDAMNTNIKEKGLTKSRQTAVIDFYNTWIKHIDSSSSTYTEAYKAVPIPPAELTEQYTEVIKWLRKEKETSKTTIQKLSESKLTPDKQVSDALSAIVVRHRQSIQQRKVAPQVKEMHDLLTVYEGTQNIQQINSRISNLFTQCTSEYTSAAKAIADKKTITDADKEDWTKMTQDVIAMSTYKPSKDILNTLKMELKAAQTHIGAQQSGKKWVNKPKIKGQSVALEAAASFTDGATQPNAQAAGPPKKRARKRTQ